MNDEYDDSNHFDILQILKKDLRENEVCQNLVGDMAINDQNRSQNVKTKYEPITLMFL